MKLKQLSFKLILHSRQKKRSFIRWISIGTILLMGYFYSNKKDKTDHNRYYGTIEQLEKQLFNAKSKEEITALLMQHPLFSKEFLKIETVTDPGNYTKIGKALFELYQDPYVQSIYEESKRQLPNFSLIAEEFQQAFHRLKKYYPNIKHPKIYTIITGMQHDFYISNGLIVIGIDFFLGQNNRFRPNHLPKYIADSYHPSSIVSKIMLHYTQQFNNIDASDKTLLAEMLHYGKSLFLVKTLLPHLADSLLLGYTAEQLKEVNRHQTIIWDHFIEHELLYNMNHLIKVQYINPRPFTGEIGSACPGSIGKWLGWEIIKKYMKQNKKVTIQGLMASTDSTMILRNACYRPRNKN